MTPRAARRAVTALLLVASPLGCRGVPDYRIEDDPPSDGAADAGLAPADASDAGDAANDAPSAADAGADAPPPSGCPGEPPPYATTCCGPVPCAGDCATACAECAARCGASEVCCAKRNNVLCKRPDGFVCN